MPAESNSLPSNSENVEDIVDLLGSDDDKPTKEIKEEAEEINEDKKEDKKDKSEDEIDLEDDVDDEELEEEEEVDYKEEDELEIETAPRKRDIVAKYPKLFKDFPWLEKMMYRDRQIQERFGSFDDITAAMQDSKTLDGFRAELGAGNTVNLLKQIKDHDSKSFDKVVDNYLDNLRSVDKDAFIEVVGNVGKQFIYDMYQEAKESNDDDLREAANILNKFLFRTSKWTAPKKRVDVKNNEDDNEKNELNRERTEFARQRFETVRGDMQSRVDNLLKNTISRHIDPKEVMSEYVKKNAIRDAFDRTYTVMQSDRIFMNRLNDLWKASFETNHSQTSQDRIRKAILSKAKEIMKSTIVKARAEALKDSSSKKSEDNDDSPRKRISNPGRPSQPKSERLTMKKGESVDEFFARD